MDINSLLSPQDPPVRETPPPSTLRTSSPNLRRAKTTSSATIRASPLSQTSFSSDALLHNAALQARPAMPSPPGSNLSQTRTLSTADIPPFEQPRTQRMASTSGMDTLADLASMQHHQQTARANAGGLRSTESYDSQLSAANIRPSLQTAQRAQSGSRNSLDMLMADAPAPRPPPKTFRSAALSEADLRSIGQLVEYLEEHPCAYESHVRLVKLLYKGLYAHVYPSSSSIPQADPREYELLGDLHQAVSAMETKFALGEELWTERLQAQQLLASSLDECLTSMELFLKAITEEVGSIPLWRLYGAWMESLYAAANPGKLAVDDTTPQFNKAIEWSDEDKIVAHEVFNRVQLLETWKRASEDTKYHIRDSHLIWDRYTRLLMAELAQSPSKDAILAVRDHFVERLQVPHATWDQTFQMFSTFVSTYDNIAYEETMVTVTRIGADAKNKFHAREIFELRLKSAQDSQDQAAEWSTFSEYLEWELSQSRKKKFFSSDLCNALYQRTSLRFPTVVEAWEDYLIFLGDEFSYDRRDVSLLPILERASAHCPWSGTLWSQYIQAAERENLAFDAIGQIKHKATSTGLLEVSEIEETLKVLTAWCCFLRRQAFQRESTDEEFDVAEVGIRSAIEDTETLGRQKYGKDYKGDPLYRLERIYVMFLSQSRNYNAARDTWKNLIARHGDSYEFWQRYYTWEMLTWSKQLQDDPSSSLQPPREATKVLRQAIRRPHMDWPEKLIDTLIYHCEDYEDATEQQSATIQARKSQKIIEKRRQKESLQAALSAREQQQQQVPQEVSTKMDASYELSSNGKRKRDEPDPGDLGGLNKKSRPDTDQVMDELSDPLVPTSSNLKRDRENTSVVIKNLPYDTNEKRVRHYFRDCGNINSLNLTKDKDGNSVSAFIEFDSKEDVLAAQTRDMKVFDGNAIEVQLGMGRTIYVANFPPTGDEDYIRRLFAQYGEIVQVRFPSLKYNTHRRFCYIEFKTSQQAQAATVLDDTLVGDGEDKLKLIAKISDPSRKQDRSGALHECRELYVANVDWAATAEDLQEVFSKYGKVENVRLPRKRNGQSKGMAFIVFSSKDEATAALDLNLTKFKSRLLNVSLATENRAQRQAITVIASEPSASSSPQAERRGSTASATSNITRNIRDDIVNRTIALLNVPDTVNDARIRAMVESYGPLSKIILRPDHQGAIIEFQDVASAGKAAMALEGHEIMPGRKLGVGTVEAMLAQKAEYHKDKLDAPGQAKKKAGAEPAKMIPGAGTIKRPGQQAGRRGGLGVKRGGRGLEGVRATRTDEGAVEKDDMEIETGKKEGGKDGGKSNADFKAMFLKQG